MDLSPQQERALAAVKQWLVKGQSPVFRLFGYAGTGKTTLAKLLAEGAAGRTFFAAYTGKAAYVLRSRGCPEATTIHRLIYKPAGKSTSLLEDLEQQLKDHLSNLQQAGALHEDAKAEQLRQQIKAETEHVKRPAFVLNPDSPLHGAGLVVIDECSMVDEQMGQDLLSFRAPILVLGDPAQLPPVRGEGYFTADAPDVMLTEIHRQAKDSPIIQLATTVRTGGRPAPGAYGDSLVADRTAFSKELVRSADQVIVGRNVTRRNFNANHRKHLLGFQEELPCPGDKLVCLRNNHEVGLLNGGTWTVVEAPPPLCSHIPLTIQDDDQRLEVFAHEQIFRGEEVPWWERRDAEEFDFGYALTCHKAQGSQWQHVLVIDESACFGDKARAWLYTALTRASKRITLLQ